MRGFIKISSSILFSVLLLLVFSWVYRGEPQFLGFPPSVENVYAAQFGRPDTDISDGNWTDATGGDNDGVLWEEIDETTASDTDYIQSANDPSSNAFEVSLSDVTDPQSSSGHIVRARERMQETGGGQPGNADVTVALVEGTTVIASQTYSHGNNDTIYYDRSFTLTSGEADSITNYGDLRIRVTANKTGGARTNWTEVTWAELEVPDAPPPDLSWNTGAADFEIWESSSATWDAGTLICSGSLTDDDASTITCSSGSVAANTQYRVQVELDNIGSSGANMASGDVIDHMAVKGGWAGTNPTLGSCLFNDNDSDDGSTTCNLVFNNNDVRITNTGAGNVVIAASTGSQGFGYLITTDSDVPSSDATSHFAPFIDNTFEDSSKISISGPVGNSLPVASSVSIDSGAASVTLTENTTTAVSCAGTVTDDDGFSEITSVTADFYRTNVGTSSPTDENNYYQLSGDTECVPSGGSGTTENYTCNFDVWYYADPTDAGSPNEATDWTCTMIPSDAGGQGTADSDTIEMATTQALSVSPSVLVYLDTDAGQDTGSWNGTTTVTNTGNVDIDPQLSGEDLVSGGNTITVSNQEYSASPFTYGSGSDLTGGATYLDLTLPQRTSTEVTDGISWGIGVPEGTPGGTYQGTTTLTAAPGL